MSYLGWVPGYSKPVSGSTPFTYGDGITHLEKLEDLYSLTRDINQTVTDLVALEAADVKGINDRYVQLVADWNAALALLDPNNVSAQVAAFNAQYGGAITSLNTSVAALTTRIGAQETKEIADVQAARDQAAADLAAATAALNSTVAALAATQAADNTARANAITALDAAKENKDDVAGHVDSRILDRLSAVNMPNPVATQLSGMFTFPKVGRQGGMFFLSTYCTTGQKTGQTSANSAMAALMSDLNAYAATLPSFNGAGSSGGTIVLDGTFMFDATVFNGIPRGTVVMGLGRYSSRIVQASGDFINLGPGHSVDGLVFRDFAWTANSGGGAFLRMGSTSPANEAVLVGAMFSNLSLLTKSTTEAMVNITGYSEYHQNLWISCAFDRPSTSNAHVFVCNPAIGNMTNSNSFQSLWVHGHNCTGKPAFFVGAANAAWLKNWGFYDICGEQNCGGLLDLRGVSMGVIRNVIDWDAAVSYTMPVIYLGKTAQGTPCVSMVVEASGRPTEVSLPNPTYDVQTDNGVTARVSMCNPQGARASIIAGDKTQVDDRKPAFTYVNASYTVTDTDETVMCGGSGGYTVTLNQAGSDLRKITLWNSSASEVTVNVASGGFIMGQATYTLPVYTATTFYCDGQMNIASGRWSKVG